MTFVYNTYYECSNNVLLVKIFFENETGKKDVDH